VFSGLLFKLLTLLLVSPCLFVVWFFIWRARRDWKRRRDGWWVESEYIGYNGAFISEYAVRYCESDAKLGFSGDDSKKGARGRMVVFVPTEENWRESAPAWAKEQREEIIARLERHFDCEVDEKKRFWSGYT